MSTPRIVIDSREQKPYKFPGQETTSKQLEVGDYTYEGFEDTFVVERKSLNDLTKCIGADRLRFENEIRRANGFANQNASGNPLPGTKPDSPWKEFVVVIESPKDSVYQYRNQSKCPSYYGSLHPNSVIGTVEKWPNKYSELSFEWCGSRAGAKQETLRLLDRWYIKYQ